MNKTDEFVFSDEIFDESGMLLPGNEEAENTRNAKIRDIVWPLFEIRNLNDKAVLDMDVKRLKRFLFNNYFS